MSKILGLDLGTNSIGWAVVEKVDGQLQPYKHKDTPTKGVIIFPEGVNVDEKTKQIKSRAAERTDHRGGRRLKFRRKIRKYQTLLVLAKEDMCPLTVDEVKAWRKSNFKKYPDKKEFIHWLRTDEESNINPYFFRDKASREKICKMELGRALYHIAQRRGFKSNRLEQSDENIIEEYKDKILELLEKIDNPAELKIEVDKQFKDYLIEETKKGVTTLKFKKEDDLDATGKSLRKTWNKINNTLQGKTKIKKEKDEKQVERLLKTYTEQKEYLIKEIQKREYLGKVKGGIKELSEKMKETGCDTLGQYFWHLYKKDRHHADHKIRGKYTGREEHYLEEFDLICQKQELDKINKDYSIKNPSKRYSGLVLDLYKAIFYQRPLKSQKGLVGNCIFENNKPRCPVSRPEFEEYRMWQFINNIKIKTPADIELRPLTNDEKEKIIPKFYREKSSFKFEEIASVLVPKEEKAVYYKSREAKEAKYVINYKGNTSVSGCPVSAALKNVIGKNWKTETFTYQAINHKGETVTRKVNYEGIWHVWFTYDNKEKLREFAKEKLGMDDKKAVIFSKITTQQSYANLSLKAIKKILVYLRKGLIYDKAVFMANIENVVDEGIWESNKEEIENGIGQIIDQFADDKKIVNAINNLIAECRKGDDEHRPFTNSKEAELRYKEDLEKKFQDVFGKVTWQKRKDKESILEEAFPVFIEQLKKNELKGGEFAKVKRLDERVKEFLLGNNENGVVYCSNKKRLEKNLYHPSDLEKFKPIPAKDKDGNFIQRNGKALHILPLPKTDAIKNPVLMRSMHILRKLINELLLEDVIDAKTAIHIEMAREINPPNKRKAIEQWQKLQEEKKKEAIVEIKKLYKTECGKDVEPTKDDVLRYLLWNEQERRTIYEKECTQISICDIIGENPEYDYEHTLPRSRSWDNSMENKTLCSRAANQAKGNNIPAELTNHVELANHEEILQRIDNWRERYEKLDKEIKGMKPSSIQDEDTRNKAIQKKHLKTIERDYWKGKYERFIMEEIPGGFKNSQKSDIGLITRFAREYLGCLFKNTQENSNVFVVNGSTVDIFRKAWGVHKTIKDKDGIERKDRSNHIHHCIDAMTVACITRDKYDLLVQAWEAEDHNKKTEAEKIIKESKPWKDFTNDIRNKLQQEVLIVHTYKDNVPKQSRKKMRKRGKIQYRVDFKKDANGNYLRDKKGKRIVEKHHYLKDINGNKIPLPGKRDKENPDFILHKFRDDKTKEIKWEVLQPGNSVEQTKNTINIWYSKYVKAKKTGETVYMKQPIYLKGDTARGRLHQDTFYGAIKQPELDENGKQRHTEKGAFILQKDKDGKDKIFYVVRKEINKISEKDIYPKKEDEGIVDSCVREIIQQKLKAGEIKFKVVQKKKVLNIPKDVVIWKNENKRIPIKRVRVKTSEVKNPLPDFKKHRMPFLSPKRYKQQFHVMPAENYSMVLYENGNERDFELFNNYDFSRLNKEDGHYYPINKDKIVRKRKILLEPMNRNGKDVILQKGLSVIFYDKQEKPKELAEFDKFIKDVLGSDNLVNERIYKITELSIQRQRQKSGIINEYGIIKFKLHNDSHKSDDLKKINYKPDGEFKNGEFKPTRKMNHNQFNALVEGIDFKITTTGKITPTGKIEKL